MARWVLAFIAWAILMSCAKFYGIQPTFFDSTTTMTLWYLVFDSKET